MKALIENIQHYCLHDGPGTRTTVFFKGCPLRCLWCSNPATQNFHKELLYKSEECLRCGECAKVCPEKAVSLTPEGTPVIDRERCSNCGLCVSSCLGKALAMAGKEYTLREVVDILKEDTLFYHNSGGGVTFSGGEVLAHHESALALAHECRRLGISIAMETSGFGSYEYLFALASVMDDVFFDLKHCDEEEHRKLTGQSNLLILENLRRLGQERGGIHLRFPLIPSVNDAPEHLLQLGAIAASLKGIADLEVLPYHRFGQNKYEMLGRQYLLPELLPPSQENLVTVLGHIRSTAGTLRVICNI